MQQIQTVVSLTKVNSSIRGSTKKIPCFKAFENEINLEQGDNKIQLYIEHLFVFWSLPIFIIKCNFSLSLHILFNYFKINISVTHTMECLYWHYKKILKAVQRKGNFHQCHPQDTKENTILFTKHWNQGPTACNIQTLLWLVVFP